MIMDFNFTWTEEQETADLVTESDMKTIKLGQMKPDRMERIFKHLFRKYLGSGENKVTITDVNVPKRPRREKSPIDSQHYQSFNVRVSFSDGQKMAMLVQFASPDDGSGKIKALTDPTVRGFITEIKVNGGAIPLTSVIGRGKGVEAQIAKFGEVLALANQALESNKDKFLKRAAKRAEMSSVSKAVSDDAEGPQVDKTGNDLSTRLNQTDEQRELARKMRNLTGGGMDDEKKLNLKSKKEMVDLKRIAVDEQRKNNNVVLGQLELFREEAVRLFKRETELKDRRKLLLDEIAEFDSKLVTNPVLN